MEGMNIEGKERTREMGREKGKLTVTEQWLGCSAVSNGPDVDPLTFEWWGDARRKRTRNCGQFLFVKTSPKSIEEGLPNELLSEGIDRYFAAGFCFSLLRS